MCRLYINICRYIFHIIIKHCVSNNLETGHSHHGSPLFWGVPRSIDHVSLMLSKTLVPGLPLPPFPATVPVISFFFVFILLISELPPWSAAPSWSTAATLASLACWTPAWTSTAGRTSNWASGFVCSLYTPVGLVSGAVATEQWHLWWMRYHYQFCRTCPVWAACSRTVVRNRLQSRKERETQWLDSFHYGVEGFLWGIILENWGLLVLQHNLTLKKYLY